MKTLLKKQLLAVRESDGKHKLPEPKAKRKFGGAQRKKGCAFLRRSVQQVLSDEGVDLTKEILSLARTTQDDRVRLMALSKLYDKVEPNKKDIQITNKTTYEEAAGLIAGLEAAKARISARPPIQIIEDYSG